MSTQNDLAVGRAITIPSSAGGVTLEESSFVLEIAYKVPGAALGPLGRRAVTLPHLDIPVMAATWHVYLPAAIEPLSFDSNLKQMNGIRYDPLRRVQHFFDAALRIQSAWADGGKYENILSNRKAIYRKEQSRAVDEPLSSFPLIGVRYRFEQVLLGERQAVLEVAYLDRALLPWVRILALVVSVFVSFRVARRALAATKGPGDRSVVAAAALALLSLGLLGQSVLGVHRMMLLGVDVAIVVAIAPSLWKRWRERALIGMARPLPAANLARLSTLTKMIITLVVVVMALKTPLLLTTFFLVLLLVLAIRLRTAPPPPPDLGPAGPAGTGSQSAAVVVAVAVVFGALAAGASHAQDLTLPLDQYERTQRRLLELQRDQARASVERPVIVGETRYRGKSDGRSLRLTLTLRAQLSSSNTWKSVPVIGTDAIIVGASAGGQPVPLVADGPYWTWHTREQGTVEVSVDVVVPPRGPRGSLEYGFHTVESPVTEVNCFFPAADLQPQVTGAQTFEITPVDGGISLHATLRPTSEIHVVGFHDASDDDDGASVKRQAKLYSETESLVSLTDDGVDVFAVVKLTILYASAQRFRVQLPAGYDVVSANGEGAFQYTVTKAVTEGVGAVLVGETAFPIKQRYEISLRLKRPLAASEKSLALPVLKLLDVERDTGFVAVEIPGKLSVAGASGAGLLPIDVRELPPSLVESSVSPIVKAFRYAGQREEARLELARYPEQALAAGGVDNVKATSVVTEDGRVMTDLAFTIRNNVQQYLSLKLPEGALVRSAVLEGNPIKPSKDDAGRVLIPLMRSKRGDGGGALKPFHVQLVYESDVSALGSFGARALTLPELDVPVSSLSWGIYVPARYLTSGLKGAVEPEEFVRNATFSHGRSVDGDGDDDVVGIVDEDNDENQQFGQRFATSHNAGGFFDDGDAPAAAVPTTPAAREDSTGAMPVRVQLPTTGMRLVTTRYWLDPHEALTVSFRYAQIPVVLLLEALLGLLCAAAFVVAFARGPVVPEGEAPSHRLPRPARLALLGVGVACAVVIGAKLHTTTVVVAVVVALGVILWRRGSWRGAVAALSDVAWLNREAVENWARALRDREAAEFGERRAKSLLLALAVPAVKLAWTMFKLGAIFVATCALAFQLVELGQLLMNPL
jgi:hypothetical protein